MIKINRASLFAAFMTLTTAVHLEALQPVNLRSELRVNPLGIGTAVPHLSWQLQSDGLGVANRGDRQSAYQIQVGSAPGASDLWDSGQVYSSETAGILYGGAPLTSGEECFWHVRVYNAYGYASDWSQPAEWSVGLLNATD